MRILAMDSSGLVATVAILEDDQMIAEYTVNYKFISFNMQDNLGYLFLLE